MAAPESEKEVLARARALAGHTLDEVAARIGVAVPSSLAHAKGFVGQLVEMALGALARSRPVPDFEALGVELKTIPIDRAGRPRQSTYVTTLDPRPANDLVWETSSVRRKLARVLWVPVEAERGLPIGSRRIGTAFLWSPNAEEEHALREDYEDLVGLVAQGWVDSITGHRGRVLQVRPKAASARATRLGIDSEGGVRATLPRGFYLRRTFTESVLRRVFFLDRG